MLQPTYQEDLKEENNKSLGEPTSEKISEVLYTKKDVDKDHYYSNKLNDKLFIGFMGIKFICTHYSKTFTLKTLLYKYLKSCIIQQQVSPSIDVFASLAIPFIESSSLAMGFGTSFGFRD